MIVIKEINIEGYIDDLIGLSKIWADEDITNGLVPNTRDDLKQPCVAAFDGNKMIGYVFGHHYIEGKNINTIKEGTKCFSVDEIYVLKNYRSQGVGSKLFKEIEKIAYEQAEYITLPTSTKDYKKIFKFYIEDNDMIFHSAFLYKKINS